MILTSFRTAWPVLKSGGGKMYELSDIQITRVSPVKHCILVCAKYSDWSHEDDLFINPDGSVIGKTSSGSWLELSQTAASLIRQKVSSQVTFSN
jgi:hypothetical protein